MCAVILGKPAKRTTVRLSRKGARASGGGVMEEATAAVSRLKLVLSEFGKAEDGAALIEYTVLLGMLLVAVVAIIGAVGTWINGKWAALNTALHRVDIARDPRRWRGSRRHPKNVR
jgi:pilus assembly protein Flp/PilA